MRKIYTPLQGVMFTLSLILLISEFTFAKSNLNFTPVMAIAVADINISASGSTNICQGNSVTLSVSGSYSAYQWSTGDTTSSISVNASGSYFLSVTDSLANTLFSDTVTITVGAPATANAGSDVSVCGYNELGLNGSIGGSASSALWLGGTTSSFLDGRNDLTGGYLADTSEYGTVVTLVLQTNDPGNGCPVATDTVEISVLNVPDLQSIPDQFNTCPFTVFDLASIPVVDANNTVGIYAYQDAFNVPLASSTVTASGLYHIVKATLTTPTCFDIEPVNVTIGSCTCALVLTKTFTDATCPGASDGSIDLTVSGGTAPYSYIWTTGDTTQDLTGLPAGFYSVVVTDLFFCMDTVNVTISEQSALTVSCSVNNQATCPGSADGSLLTLPSGAVSPISYEWKDANNNTVGGNSPLLSGIMAGNYTAIITDGSGCIDSCSVALSATGMNDTTMVSATTCDTTMLGISMQTLSNQAGCDSVIITTTTLQPGDTTFATATTCDTSMVGVSMQILSNQAGCDSIIITNTTLQLGDTTFATATTCDTSMVGVSMQIASNQAGCDSLVITTTSLANNCTTSLSCSIVGVDAICNGENSGSAVVNASGGLAPYTYLWSTGDTTASVSNLAAGNYSVVVMDDAGATGSCAVTISEPSPLDIICSVLQNVTCAGGSDGAIDFTILGGTQPYNVSVVGSNGLPVAINGIASGGLLANTYTVTVTDSTGCVDTCMVTITEPDSLVATCTIDQEILCYGQHATASASVVGGIAPYTYSWSDGSTNAVNDSLSIGTHTVTITDSVGCITACSVVITEPAELTLVCTIDQEISCVGANDAVASVTVSGGTAPYIYAWSNGMSTSSISNLAPGVYNVVVLDSNNCSMNCSVTIIDATPLSPIVASAIVPMCDNNTLTLQASGNYPNYSWIGPDSFVSGLQSPSFIAGTAASGMYIVTATDTNGCSVSDSVMVTINACFNLGDQTWVDLNQDGLFNGIDTALAGVTVTLNDSAGNPISTTTTDSLGNYLFTDLLPGNYYVTFGNMPNLTFTTFNAAGSQINGANGPGTTGTISITNADVLTVDAGYVPGISVGDFVWLDVNGNGLPDDGDTGIPGVLVTLHDSTTGIAVDSVLTDLNGNYLFTGVVPGGYYVNFELLSGYGYTNYNPLGSQIIIPNGNTSAFSVTSSSILTIDAGFIGMGTIGDLVWEDLNNNGLDDDGGTGIDSVVVQLTYLGPDGILGTSDDIIYTDTTDSNGNYSFINLPPGSFVVEVMDGTGTVLSLYSSTTGGNTSAVTLGPGAMINNMQDFGYLLNTNCTPPILALIPTHIVCHGDATGAIDLQVTSQFSPFTYIWSNNSTNEDQSNLVAGTYTVTVTDAGGCSAVASITLIENLPFVIGKQVTNVSCYGSSDGVAVVSVSGGVGPYTYLWNTNPAQTNFIATGLSAGSATVTITDAVGCVTSTSITIIEPSLLDASVNVVGVTCNGAGNGSVTVNPIGGTPYSNGSYDYLWNTIPAQTTQTATGLSGGFYTVVISDSIWCTKTVVVSVPEPDVLMVNINPFHITCNGGNNGKATAIPSGGTPPYTYSWSDGQSNQVATNLTAGNYSVMLTDANGCTAISNFTILEPAAIVVNAIVEGVTCGGANNGKISLNVSGGTSPYSYLWSTTPVLTTSIISNLTAGSYSVVIIDANGCQHLETYIISDPNPIDPVIQVANVSCFNGNDGSAVITQFNGGIAPYNILWSNGNSTMSNTGLSAGTYYLTVTDSLGCAHFDSVSITEPMELMCNSIVSDATCHTSSTGAIITAVTGGTPPYMYMWSDNSTNANLTGLAAGAYTLTLTDTEGCSKTEVYTIGEPSEITLVNSVTNVSCAGGSDGSVTANPGGGTPPYSYSWSDGQLTQTASGLVAGTYTLNVIDANGCLKVSNVTITEPDSLIVGCSVINTNCSGANDGSITAIPSGGSPGYTYAWNSVPVQTTQTATNLPPGTYTVVVTDQNNCTASSVCSVAPAGQLICTTTTTNISCHGGSNGTATVNASGGTAPYSYTWLTSPVQNTQTVIGLSAGTYQVIVTDAVGCSDTCVATISEPATLVALYVPVNPTCPNDMDGSIDVTIVGGTAPYTYSWTNGASTEDLTGIGAGIYGLTVIDANNCQYQAFIILTEPPLLVCTITAMNESCGGALDGSAVAQVSGGTAPYTFAWSNGSTDNSINNIAAGTYTLAVTDINGCTSTCIAVVSSPPVLSCNINILSIIDCNGAATGSVEAVITGGIAPFAISWNTSPVQTTAIATGLTAGTYTATIFDANGCSTSCSVTLSEPSELTCSTTCTHVNCNGGSDGTAFVTAQGGTAPYSYSWNTVPSQIGQLATGLSAGVYTALITDANGCTTTCSIDIIEPPALLVNVIIDNVSCNGASDGTATAQVVGGTAPYSYLWSTGDTTASVSGLSQGQYILTVVDSHNCSISVLVMITEPNPIGCSVLNTPVTCNGGNDGTATVGAAGGLQPFTYEWSTSPIQNSITATDLMAGTYTVTVTDALGCTSTCSTTLVEPTALVCSTAVLQNIDCNNNSVGIAQAFAGGGSGPYTFSWNTNPVQTTAIASGLIAGTYVVTITDALGCTSDCSITITQPDQLLCSINNLQLSCENDTGSLSVVVSGGTPNYSYIWNTNPVQTTATATGIGPGTYTVVVTDMAGCSTACTIAVQGANPIVVNTSSTPENCVGASDGTASVVLIQGGVAPYSYQWNTIPVQTTQVAAGLSSGIYEILVTDINGCTATQTAVVGSALSFGAAITNTQNVSCNQASDGEATVSPTGGFAPFTYLWSNGQTNPTAILLAANTYTVVVTDFYGCTAIATATISEPTPITCNVTITDASCFSASDGSIVLSNISGGTAPYTYLWNSSPVQTTQSLINVPHGTYTVTITDANGCTVQKTATINEPSEIVCSTTSTPASCGVNNGTATVAAVGGAGGYTYSWSTVPVQTNATAVTLAPGSYTVVVTDLKNCTSVCTVLVNGTDPITCTTTTIPVSCNGGSDGSVTITNTIGGVPPYTYTWNTIPVQMGTVVTGLSAGTYTVVINSADGCSGVKSVVVLEPGPVPAPIISSNSPICNGDIIMLTSNAGYASYSWTGPNNFGSNQQNPTFSSTLLANGIYTLTVTDIDGCTASASVNVSVLSCVNVGDLAWLDLNGNGIQDPGEPGLGGITVTLYDALTNTPTSFTTTTDSLGNYLFTDVPSGNYYAVFTDVPGLDFTTSTPGGSQVTGTNGPGSTNDFVVGNTDVLTIDAGYVGEGIIGDYVWVDTNGNGVQDDGNTGISGAVVQLTWYGPDGILGTSDDVVVTDTTDASGNYQFNNLPPGDYEVVIFDGSGTVLAGLSNTTGGDTTSVTLSPGDMVDLEQDFGYVQFVNVGDQVWIDSNQNGLFDSGEQVVPNVVVLLHDSTGNVIAVEVTDSSGNYLFTNVTPGDYYVTFGNVPGYAFTNYNPLGSQVDGSNGPGTTPTFTVNNTDVLTIDAGYIGTGIIGDYVWEDTNGNGLQDDGNTGISGAVVQLTWYGPDGILGTADDVILTDTTDSNGAYLFEDLEPGDYDILVLDGSGTVLVGFTNTTGGNMTSTTLSPGNMDDLDQDFGYQQGQGVNVGDFTWIDLNGNGIFDSGEPVLSGIGVTLYTSAGAPVGAQTTDSSGNYLFSNVAPGNYYVVFDSVPGYNYTMYNPAGSQVNGANGPGSTPIFNVSTTDVLTIDQGYLGSGTIGDYVWEDTNGNGLQDDGNTGIPGAVVLLTWYGPDGILGTSDDVVYSDTTDANGGYLFQNLPPGNYDVMVLDGSGTVLNGFNSTTGGNMTSTTLSPGNMDDLDQDFGYQQNCVPASLSVSPTNVLCHGDSTGSIDLTISGGTAPFLYLWSNGVTTEDLNNVPTGIYTITVISNGGCSATTQAFIGENPPLSCVIADSTCTIDFDLSQLQSGEFVAEQYANIGLHISGTGNQGLPDAVIVYDSNDSTQVLDPDLQVGLGNLLILPSNVVDSNNDSLVDFPDDSQFGGTMTFLFDNPVDINSLVIVDQDNTDLPIINAYDAANNLVATTTVPQLGDMSVQTVFLNATNVSKLEIVAFASVAIGPIDIVCVGGDISATVTPTGGVGPYTYSWNTVPAQTTQAINGLGPGTYVATVTDFYGCTTTCDIVIETPCPQVSLNVRTYNGGKNVSCNQSSDGTIYALANGGTAPYTYQWSSGQNSAIVSSLSVGTYMLTVSDSNGCVVTKSVTLTEPDVLTCLTNSLTDVSCNGGSDGSISISISGGNGPYESVWNTTPVTYGGGLSNMPAGSYTLSVTDTNGCVDVQTYQIDEPEALFVFSKKTNVLCNKGNDGTIDLKVSKGTAPYTFLWNDGTTTEDRINLKRGYYTVTVTDFNGCVKVHTKFINHPKRLIPARSVSHVSCYNGSDGAIDLNITGGQAPYSYIWSDGVTTEDRSNLAKGWYGFTVTDNNGCTVARNVKVNQAKFIYLTVTPQDVTTPGGNDGAVTTTVSGGVAPYSYLWSNGATTSSISGLVAGTYSLTLTDANGCVKYRNPVVDEPVSSGPLSCNAMGSTIPCGTNTGTTTVTVTGGFPPYNYFWNTNPSQSTQTATGLAPGTYLVQVTDNRGASSAVFCFATVSCNNAKTSTAVVENESLLSVYPNPFDNEINLNVLSVFEDEAFEVQVIDILGKTHHYSIVNATRGINTHKLKLVNLPAGIYFVKLKSNTSSFTERIIKH